MRSWTIVLTADLFSGPKDSLCLVSQTIQGVHCSIVVMVSRTCKARKNHEDTETCGMELLLTLKKKGDNVIPILQGQASTLQ